MQKEKYKQTEIGEVPEEWDVVTIPQIALNLDNKRKPLSSNERSKMKGQYPYYGAAGIIDYVNDHRYDGDYLLIAEDGTVTKDGVRPMLQLARGKFWVSNHAHVLQCENRKDTLFLYYQLSNTPITGFITGAVQPKLSQENLNKIKFPWTKDFGERGAITKILSDLDEKIELNCQMNKTLEAIGQAIFKRWFVEFEPWGGEQPDDWQSYTLGDISVLSAGGDRPKVYSEKLSITCTIPIYSNGIDNDGLYGYTNSAKIIDESVTVSARGTIGFTCLRQVPYFPIVRLISLVPNPRYLSAKYLYLWLKNINISGTGTTQQQLTVPDFKKTEILIPTPEIMKRFTIVADSIFAQITANKNENTSITAIRDSLLPRLMSGRVRVSGG